MLRACLALGLALLCTPASAAGLEGLARALRLEVDHQLLWQSADDEPLPPASLTKLLTALLVAEAGALDQPVTISARAAGIEGSRAGLRAGERYRTADLLTALLVRSANDACIALAEAGADGEAAFVAAMNRRAAALGMRQSHFTNPCGFDAPGHRSSAHDLARLAWAASESAPIARRAQALKAEIRSLGGRRIQLTSTNAMLGHYPGLRGLKTGHTAQAGDCLIALAERDGHRVLLVMLAARSRWWDTTALLDSAFAAINRVRADAP